MRSHCKKNEINVVMGGISMLRLDEVGRVRWSGVEIG